MRSGRNCVGPVLARAASREFRGGEYVKLIVANLKSRVRAAESGEIQKESLKGVTDITPLAPGKTSSLKTEIDEPATDR